MFSIDRKRAACMKAFSGKMKTEMHYGIELRRASDLEAAIGAGWTWTPTWSS